MLDDINLKLLLGKPIKINNIDSVFALKIEEIVDMGEHLYNQYLNILLYDVDLIDIPKEIMDEMGIDKLTTYHFLILTSYNDEQFKKMTIDALETFFKKKVFFHEKALFFCLESDEITPITLEMYELFRKILIKQNYLKELEEEDNLVFGNDMARQWYLEMKRKEKTQPKPKNNVDLQSIISAVMWKSGKSVDEILKMTIYQLYDGYYRLSIIDDCNNLVQGIYHGTIDKKNIKDSELNWAKIIKFDKN